MACKVRTTVSVGAGFNYAVVKLFSLQENTLPTGGPKVFNTTCARDRERIDVQIVTRVCIRMARGGCERNRCYDDKDEEMKSSPIQMTVYVFQRQTDKSAFRNAKNSRTGYIIICSSHSSAEVGCPGRKTR